MSLRQKVALEGIRFFSHHGFYPEEQLTGNDFIVDIVTEMNADGTSTDELPDTVNYERLFFIASEETKNTSKLIETVAHRILQKIQQEFPGLLLIEVSIRKPGLPMQGQIRNALVQLTYRQ